MAKSVFITGTDTEVGKTRVSAALLHWCAQQGWRSAGFKPVAAGLDAAGVNEDVQMLRAAGSLALTDAEVGPLQFQAACAPHIAAALEGQTINMALLVQKAQALAARADVLVVEGVGGFCVPLGPDADTADLAVALGYPVILVVGLRLGCISHALLTAEAIRARGLPLAGWVANTIDPHMPHLQANIDTLRHEFQRRHQAPCLGVVPRLADASPDAAAACLDPMALHKIFSA
ncbi:MAG: dethiobiotin synthase [Rhodoferax sp.]|uniref:dethiobiotin synthase n=1 Tax=Rhodoferax sp. TaxID=50421 RepID=UPI00326375E4